MIVQAGLCRTCSETTLLVFPGGGSNDNAMESSFVKWITIAQEKSETNRAFTDEPPRGKTNNVVFEQVRHKPACTVTDQRTNGPVNAHLSLLHIPINMFEYYGI